MATMKHKERRKDILKNTADRGDEGGQYVTSKGQSLT